MLFRSFLVVSVAMLQSGARSGSSEYPAPSIREEQTVMVHGVPETWRLQWREKPKPYCEPSDASLTCPCTGFAFGEGGDLFLLRLRDGKEIERLHLTPLFTEEGQAVLQRWHPDNKRDFKLAERADFTRIVARRPVVKLMHFADYDHDGYATEFYLQTEALPCGKSMGVVIGVSKNNPKLHVFGTASKPTKPLYLQKEEWEALRDATKPGIEVVDWLCGDHGADTQTELELSWSVHGIDGLRREYTCPEKGVARRLIGEKPLVDARE